MGCEEEEADAGPSSAADEPLEQDTRPPLERRRFLRVTGLALAGLVVGCSTRSRSSTPVVRPPRPTQARAVSEAPPEPVLRPFADLSTVHVQADPKAKGYPALDPGEAFDQHPAVVLLSRAVGGGRSPVDRLRELSGEGGTIVIKPNWVEPGSWRKAKITHPSLVLALAVWAADAVGERGRVLIAEGTSEGEDLPRVLEATGFVEALDRFARAARVKAGVISIVDLNRAGSGLRVALGERSRFAGTQEILYDGHGKSMGSYGDDRVGSYLIARPVLDADLVIDVAKAKVHCSAGVTLALKNLVGIVPSNDGPYGDDSLKDIPHFSSLDSSAGRKFVGNRTIGRSIADLQVAALFADERGRLGEERARKLLCVIDAIVSGQRSQFEPEPTVTSWIAVGTDPVAVDHVAARCMGFDPVAIPSLQPSAERGLGLGTADPASVRIDYLGPEPFAKYFSGERRLEPERVRADWGDSISLRGPDVPSPAVDVREGRVTVRANHDGIVRLEGDSGFLELAKAGDGTFGCALPSGDRSKLRVVAIDRHFTLSESTLA